MLFNRTVFVDSNVILYHFFGQSDDATELFSLGEKNRLRLVISLRVLDEVLFKVFLWTAREHFNIQTKAHAKLRKNSELAKKVAHLVDWMKIENFFPSSVWWNQHRKIYGNQYITLVSLAFLLMMP